MTARDTASMVEPQPNQNIAAEAFNQNEAFARLRFNWYAERAVWKTIKNLIYQCQALIDFVDTQPDACVNVAFMQ